MKKLILLTLLGPILFSCNQVNNTSSDKTGINSKDTIVSSLKQSDTVSIDIVKSSPNQAKILTENQYVRVIEYSLNPGEKDIWHTHPPRSSYVVSGGKLRVYTENAEPKNAEVTAGTSSWSGYGAKHYVENIGSTKVKIILTEIKSLQ